MREAVSLAIDRDAMNQAECAGLGRVDGNWINDDVEYGIEWPKWEHNVAKAKQLMADAGYPNGFNIDWLTPAPPYYSRGERVLSQLQAIGIRGKMQTLERAVYTKRRQGGMKEWPGLNIILAGARIGASWANWYESIFKCGGLLVRRCVLRQGSRRPVRPIPRLGQACSSGKRWPSRSSGKSSRTTTSSRSSATRS